MPHKLGKMAKSGKLTMDKEDCKKCKDEKNTARSMGSKESYTVQDIEFKKHIDKLVGIPLLNTNLAIIIKTAI